MCRFHCNLILTLETKEHFKEEHHGLYCYAIFTFHKSSGVNDEEPTDQSDN